MPAEGTYRQKLMEIDEELQVLYRRRRSVMEAFAHAYPTVLPAARQQTDKQRLVARCPRCGGQLDPDKKENET